MSNSEFGRRIGVSHSMASRIRSGDRLPSIQVIGAISREFEIPLEDLVRAHGEGSASFGKLIRSRIPGQKVAA